LYRFDRHHSGPRHARGDTPIRLPLVDLLPLLRQDRSRILIDHCGRPAPAAGMDQAGFRALLDLAGTSRVWVKLSSCVWASDWPFLRAPERIDYGPLLTLFEYLVSNPCAPRAVLRDTRGGCSGSRPRLPLVRNDRLTTAGRAQNRGWRHLRPRER
jgi:hypothetical protein